MTFRDILAGSRAYLAPAVFNPLSAKIAEAAGFDVLYLRYRILTVTTPIYAFHRATQQTYRSIAGETANPAMAGTSRKAEQAALHDTIGLDALLAIEKNTVEN